MTEPFPIGLIFYREFNAGKKTDPAFFYISGRVETNKPENTLYNLETLPVRSQLDTILSSMAKSHEELLGHFMEGTYRLLLEEEFNAYLKVKELQVKKAGVSMPDLIRTTPELERILNEND